MDTIRYVEKTILDQEYKKFKLIQRPDDLAIIHLFKVFGDLFRDLLNDITLDEPYAKKRQVLQASLRGLAHCFRWLANKPAHQVLLSESSSQDIDQEAAKLLDWGIHYDMLSLDHVAWSRGVLVAKSDNVKKIISFSYPPDFDSFFLLTQGISEQELEDAYFRNIPFKELQHGFKQWFREVKLEPQNFDIPWNLAKKTPAYTTVMTWLEDTIWPELPPHTDLSGYTLDDFRRFYAALFINCQYYTWIEDYVDTRFGPENELGSSPIGLPESNMVEWLSEMSDVNSISIHEILEDLTFDAENFHAILSNQPFVKSRGGMIYTLPRLVINIYPSRMLSGAFNKGKKRKVYERIVQSMEQSNLDSIVSCLKKLGLKVIREKRLTDTCENKIIPDLIVFDERNRYLLIADYKHILAPLSPSEVIYKMHEVQKGIKQVQKYLNFVKNNLHTLSRWIDNLDPSIKVYGLLIFRWPLPLPIYTNSEIEMIDWVSLNKKLTQDAYISLLDLIEWIKHRPDISIKVDCFELVPFEIQVADWKYLRTILVIK